MLITVLPWRYPISTSSSVILIFHSAAVHDVRASDLIYLWLFPFAASIYNLEHDLFNGGFYSGDVPASSKNKSAETIKESPNYWIVEPREKQ